MRGDSKPGTVAQASSGRTAISPVRLRSCTSGPHSYRRSESASCRQGRTCRRLSVVERRSVFEWSGRCARVDGMALPPMETSGSSWLAEPEDRATTRLIPANTTKGYPIGAEDFVRRLESKFCRSLRPRRPWPRPGQSGDRQSERAGLRCPSQNFSSQKCQRKSGKSSCRHGRPLPFYSEPSFSGVVRFVTLDLDLILRSARLGQIVSGL